MQTIGPVSGNSHVADLRSAFRSRMRNAESLEDVRDGIIDVLMSVRYRHGRIGFVSGIISSEGSEYIESNTARLDRFTSLLKDCTSIGVFSQADVFDSALATRMRKKSSRSDWYQMWEGVLKSSYITDLFMTPGWQKSGGSIDEYETAKEMGISIHHVYMHPVTNAIHISRE